MKPLFSACLFVALVSAMPLPAQDSRSKESPPSSLPASAQTREKEQPPYALRRKLLGVREQQASGLADDDRKETPPEGRRPFFKAQQNQMEKPTGPTPTFPGALPSTQGAFGNVEQEWVQHYGSGLYPSYDAATALAIDGAGNVYITGYGINPSRRYGMDYLTIKYSAAGVELWKAYYDGPDHGEDYAMAIAVDGAGNVYVTGYSYGAGTSDDYATVKYNSAGVEQWARRYDGPGNGDDVAYALKVDGSGNVYVTGGSDGVSLYFDWATIKYNDSGAQEWVQRYEGSSNYYDVAFDLAVDGPGNVFVTGYSYNSGTSYDFTTIRYNNAGVQQWVQSYNGPGNYYDYATAIAVDAAGNVYVTGPSASSGTTTSYDYATLKYNSAGVQQWVQRYSGPGNYYDYATAIAVDAAGNVYVTGTSASSVTSTSYDYATLKYNSAGVQQWEQRYNGSGNRDDYASGIALDASGNVYVSGYSYGSGTSYDYVTIKYSNAGAQQWQQSYNGPGNGSDYTSIEYARHLNTFAVDAAGNAHVTGYSYGGSNTGTDCATVKYNSAGVKQWEARYNGTGSSLDFATAIATDTAGNVYVTGYSNAAGTGYDYLTVKYSGAGVEQWHQRYNSSGSISNYAYDIAVDLSGNVYVTGSDGTIKYNSAGAQQWLATGSGIALAVDGAGNVFVISTAFRSGTSYDYKLVKYNSAGALQWTVYYNGQGSGYDYATALALDASSNVYVTGYSDGGSSYYDYATIKYNGAGVVQWAQRYNYALADSSDLAYAIAVDAAGNVYVTGESYGASTYYDYATIKYNNAGVQQWVQRATTLGAYRDRATDVAVDAAGNVFAAGLSGTVKYNPSGIPLWIAGDAADDLALDRTGNAYVANSQYNSRSGYDIVTIKYNGFTGMEEWRQTYGAPGNGADEPAEYRALALDAAGNVFVTGYSDGDNWDVYTTIKYKQTIVPPTASIKPQGPSTQFPGAEFWVDIRIDSVQNLFGASCDLSYNTGILDVVTPYSGNVIAGSFLGTDVVFFSNVDEIVGKVSIGISRKTGQSGVSGSGVIARVKFKSLASTSSGTAAVFCLSNVSANDPSGNPIPLPTRCDTTIINSGFIVWPGDTNNDGVVNQSDVLPIGLCWGQTGPARQNPSCNWVGQLATPWATPTCTYADANGDGKVDAADVLCIGLNWGKTHSATALAVGKTSSAKKLSKSNAGTLCYTVEGDTTAGGEFWVNIHAMNVMALFGFSFELLYSPTAYLDPQASEAGSFMGNDVIFFANVDKTAGKVSIGCSQKAPQPGATGSGVVARIKMKMSASAPAGQAVNLALQNVVANDAAGGSIEITPLGKCMTTEVKEFTRFESAPTAFALYAPSPNPFNPSTTLRYDLPQQVEVKFMIFDMLGRRVRTLVDQTQQAGRYAVIWDSRNEQGQPVASGKYFYQLRAGNFVKTLGMALLR